MNHSSRHPDWKLICGVQLLTLAAFGAAFARNAPENTLRLKQLATGQFSEPNLPIPREKALKVAPLYDRSDLIGDSDLTAVLKQVRPKFPREKLKPNHVEHALRIWGVGAKFQDPSVLSGEELKEFLLNHGKYLSSWTPDMTPLLIDEPEGVAVRWGSEECASVHHDHLLACLSEAGISLNEPVHTPGQTRTMNDLLQLSLRDLQLDERETEWSALAYALWLPPRNAWRNREGRHLCFDLLAERLIRGKQTTGVCLGTHRIYTLVVLLRLDEEHQVLSETTRTAIREHLLKVREELLGSQYPDGHWESNWPTGSAADLSKSHDELYKQVIGTGHHLEWLALAPREFQLPDDRLSKAIQWVTKTTIEQPQEKLLERYTFFSHVGGALALWRNTTPSEFWKQAEKTAPQAQ